MTPKRIKIPRDLKRAEDSRNEMVRLLLLGLTIDGSHHKQWALDRVLHELVTDEWYENAKKDLQWDEGIAP